MRALNALERDLIEHDPDGQPSISQPERRLDPSALPDLTHTKVLHGVIHGETISRPNWNRLRDEMLLLIMRREGSFRNLQRVLQADVNMVPRRKEDEGFRYLSAFDFSVQGQHANGACQAILSAAQGFGMSVDIEITWRRKEGAAHPGERARLVVEVPLDAFAVIQAGSAGKAASTW